MSSDLSGVPVEQISRAIVVVAGKRVILDRDLADIYGVSTKRFNEQVKRNTARFPKDFMFQLSLEETMVLRSHFATSKTPRKDGRGGVRYRPYAFTEHGAIQAANVLNSDRAVAMGVHVVRAFVRLRELLASNNSLAQKLDELERKYSHHDKAIAAMLSAIRKPMSSPVARRRGIGFTADLDEKQTAFNAGPVPLGRARKSLK